MQKILEEKLVNDFPTLFRQWHLSPERSCLGRGIECWDGWYRIIYDLCQRLVDLKLDDFVEFAQIKQKFAVLNVYLESKHKHILIPKDAYALVSRATYQSEVICEICGERGKKRLGAYLLTLCDKHYKQKQENIGFWTELDKSLLQEEIKNIMLAED